MPSREEVDLALGQAHRTDWGTVLAATARLVGGDLALAEEATQDAFVQALSAWPDRGIPGRPAAWLTTVARRRVVDAVRRDATLRRKLPALAGPDRVDPDGEDAEVFPDDRLRLVFTCCHPALAPEARAALTLRMVCGLSTGQIARAFLVAEPTMAARITRAKKKITAAGIPYRVPDRDELPERLADVLTVVHLAFTAGHTGSDSQLVDDELVARALDLARVLATLMPDEPEVLGLLALLELTDARRDARSDARGELVLLEEQDRTRWDAEEIEHGLAMLARGLRLTGDGREPGRYLLQAALAAVHDEAPTWEQTDWQSAVLLYDRLLAVWPSPVVGLNRAVAVSFADGPAAGLAALDALADDRQLAGYHYLPATRADLLRRMGRRDAAAHAYGEALRCCPEGAERRFLERRLAEVTTATTG